MKIFVVHDQLGNIQSFGIPNNKLEGLGMQPPPGASVSEVEAPEIPDIERGDWQEFQQVLDILNRSRIDVSGEKARLVPK